MHIAHEGGKGGPGFAHRKFCLIISCPVLWDSLVAQLVKNLHAIQETWVRSLDQEDPLEKEMASHFSILPGKSYGQKSLAGYSPCVISHITFSWVILLDMAFSLKKKKDGNRYPCFKSFLVFPCLLALLSEILLVFLNKFS